MKGTVTSLSVLACAASVAAQSWQFTLQTTTDSLPRLYQPLRVEIPASQFDPALPAPGAALQARLRAGGATSDRPAQVLREQSDPSKVVVLWTEESLAPGKSFTWQLTVSPGAPTGPAFAIARADSGIDVVHGTTKVHRYQDAYDPKAYGLTRKPWNHVYGVDGKYISKGNEGEHPHQRGVFMGWNLNGHGYWTDAGGTVQIHKAYDSSLMAAGPVMARVSSTISWQHDKVEELVETRTVEAWWMKPGVTVLDFRFTLTEPSGKSFSLDGEGAHAGMQFRAADEVNLNRQDPILGARHFSEDGPIRTGYNYTGARHWIGQTFPVRGVRYMGLVMDHSSNPKPEFPTRDYGRFGVFFNHVQPAGKPLPLYYRFLFADRSVQDTVGMAAAYNAFQHPPAITATRGTTRLEPGPGARAGAGVRLAGRELRLAGGGAARVTVHDLSGRLLRAGRVEAGRPLSLAGLRPGMAWVRVRGAEGERSGPLLLP